MQFQNDDDEDFSLNTAARSRLSSLFQAEGKTGDVNQALTFTAPKQPRKNEPKAESQGSSEALKLIHVAVVHAYKLLDGNYSNQGKLGCAILGHHQSASFKLLLYKGKQVHVTSCNITSSFKFHIQPNNYASFYDEKKENWSVNFESETTFIDFCKQVTLAKFHSHGKNQSSLIAQDLIIGEGPSLDTGDSAEVKYTGWLLTNFAFGQVFDSNMKSESNYRVRLGKSKVIKGWSEGLTGAQKGGKRLLIIPSNLAYGESGMGTLVPPNSTLIFEIHVMKIKISRESSHSPSPIKSNENIPEKKPDITPRHSISQEDNIRMRGASISEQLSQSPRKDKSQLICRMAKMGTAILPLQGAVAAQVSSESDSEEEKEQGQEPTNQSNSRTSSPKPPSKPHSRHSSSSSVVDQPTPAQRASESSQVQQIQPPNVIPIYTQSPLHTQSTYIASTPSYPTFPNPMVSQFQAPHYQISGLPSMIPQMATSMADTHIPLLLSETRTQNSETRVSLSKITDKVDVVIQKIDDLRSLPSRPMGFNQLPYMDGSVLIQNIERIVQENSQLKEDVESKNSKIQTLNEKICDLFQRNQRFFEESNSMLERKSDSLQASSIQSHTKLLSLEKEKDRLSVELSETLTKMKNLASELEKCQTQKSDLEEKLDAYEKEVKDQEISLNEFRQQSNELTAESEALVNSLRDEVKNVEQEKILLVTKLQTLEEKCDEMEKAESSLKSILEENKAKLQDVKIKASVEAKDLRETYEDNLKSEMLQKKLEEMLNEKNTVTSNYESLKKKLGASESSNEANIIKIQELEMEIKNSSAWKKKYETFYEKTKALKERYENQIVELMNEVKRLQSTQGSAQSDFSGEIKKTMNILYKHLQGKFDNNASYSGKEVLEQMLQVIRGLTIQMLQMKSRTSSDSSVKSQESAAHPEESSSVEPKSEPVNNDSNKDKQLALSSIDTSNASQAERGSENIPQTSPLSVESGKVENNICDTIEPSVTDIDGKSNNKENESSTSNLADISQPPPQSEKNSARIPQNESKTEAEQRDSPVIWKPQPPLFDDDEDEDDDDDWLK